MVDKGSNATVLFTNCLVHMKLPDELIHDTTRQVIGLDDHKSSLKGTVTLITSLMGKNMAVDLFLMKCNAPYSGTLGKDWTILMEVTSSTKFQCIKSPNQ